MIDLKDIPMFSNEQEAIDFLTGLVKESEENISRYNNVLVQVYLKILDLKAEVSAHKLAIQVLKNLDRKAQEDIELEREYQQSKYQKDCYPENFW